MKITLKTLKGQQLPLEVEPDMTVAALKDLIETNHGQAADTQKLIVYGKVMDDETKTVADYKLVENGFIVMMISKAKPVKKPEEAKAEEVAQPGVTMPAQAEQPSAQAQAAQPQPQPVAQPEAPQPSTNNAVGAGGLPAGIDEEALNTLVAITNKPRDMCIMALTMTRGNVDVACNLLFEVADIGQLQQMAAQMPGAGGMGAGGEAEYPDYGDEDPMAGGMPQGAIPNLGGASGATGNEALMQLFANPHFAAIAQRMRDNPQYYEQFMERMRNDQPETYAAISQNSLAFTNMLITGNPGPMARGGAGGAGAAGGMPGAGAGQPRPPQGGGIRVTQEEMAAIQRLQSLGFSQEKAAEAYLACDKNEELAANFLFENGFDDEQAQMDAAIAASQGADAAQAQVQPVAVAEPQPDAVMADASQPEAQAPAENNQPAAENNANAAADAQPPNNNNNDGDNNAGGDGNAGAGAGDGGEKSAFE